MNLMGKLDQFDFLDKPLSKWSFEPKFFIFANVLFFLILVVTFIRYGYNLEFNYGFEVFSGDSSTLSTADLNQSLASDLP